MKKFDYTIKDEAGIHARPAGLLVKAMQAYQSNISLICKGKEASCKKLFAVMGLAVKCGEMITVTADGPDEDVAIKAAEAFLKENL